MRIMNPPASGEFARSWNDAQLDGRLKTNDYQVDLGSVIPSVLERADIPDSRPSSLREDCCFARQGTETFPEQRP